MMSPITQKSQYKKGKNMKVTFGLSTLFSVLFIAFLVLATTVVAGCDGDNAYYNDETAADDTGGGADTPEASSKFDEISEFAPYMDAFYPLKLPKGIQPAESFHRAFFYDAPLEDKRAYADILFGTPFLMHSTEHPAYFDVNTTAYPDRKGSVMMFYGTTIDLFDVQIVLIGENGDWFGADEIDALVPKRAGNTAYAFAARSWKGDLDSSVWYQNYKKQLFAKNIFKESDCAPTTALTDVCERDDGATLFSVFWQESDAGGGKNDEIIIRRCSLTHSECKRGTVN
jgi:hypothetical protein